MIFMFKPYRNTAFNDSGYLVNLPEFFLKSFVWVV